MRKMDSLRFGPRFGIDYDGYCIAIRDLAQELADHFPRFHARKSAPPSFEFAADRVPGSWLETRKPE